MISVVIPVFNEIKSISILYTELVGVLDDNKEPYEIIFIDDGSTDGTLGVLKKIKQIRWISFTRNFGKSQALQAGFRAANGDYIFTLDSDLQDDPKEIPRFLEMMKTGPFDLVCGWKQNRLDKFSKNLVSWIVNALTRFMTGTKVHDMNCGFKLYRKEVAKSLALYGDMHRYIPALAAAQGFKISEIGVNHRQRKFGVSKYGNFRRFLKSAFDFVTLILLKKYIDRPMLLFGIIGSSFSFIGMAILLYLTLIKLFYGVLIGNRPLLILGVLMIIIGIQLFSSGFLGELLIRQSINKNVYMIREESGHDNQESNANKNK